VVMIVSNSSRMGSNFSQAELEGCLDFKWGKRKGDAEKSNADEVQAKFPLNGKQGELDSAFGKGRKVEWSPNPPPQRVKGTVNFSKKM